MNIYISNTNLVTVQRLKSVLDDEYIDDADVTLTICDLDGTPIALPAGQEWPLELTAVPDSPSKGDYQGIVSELIEFEPDTSYLAVIDADGGVGRVGHWEIRFVAKVRDR